jgi:hypothetical protein
MTSHFYYDRQGNPISLAQWGRLQEQDGYKRVAFTDLDWYHVSTVWLGLNHSWRPGVLHIFETMIFALDDHDDLHHLQQRYSTEAQALAGHDQIVALVRDHMANAPSSS